MVTEFWTFSTLYWTLGIILVVEGLLVVTGMVALFIQLCSQRRQQTLRDRLDRRIDSLVDTVEQQGLEGIDSSHKPKRKAHRSTMGRLLFERISASRGSRRRTLSRLYDRLGFIERDRRQTGSRRWQDRLEAMRRLFGIHSFHDRQLLIQGLDDHPKIRLLCAHILARRGNLDDLIRALNALDLTSNLMEQPVYGLLKRVDDRRLKKLLKNLHKIEQGRMRRPIIIRAALRDIEGLEAMLKRLASSDDTEDRIAVCLAADKLDDDRGLELLNPLLYDPSWQVRAQAARRLTIRSDSSGLIPLRVAMNAPDFWDSDHGAPMTPAVTATVQGETLTIRESFELSASQLELFDDYLDTAARWVPCLTRETGQDVDRHADDIADAEIAI